MAGMHWITDPEGNVDYARVRSLVSVALAVAGGLVMVGAAVLEVALRQHVPETQILIMGAALVVPITGGLIADKLRGGGQ